MKLLILGAGYIGQACMASWTNRQDSFIATTTSNDHFSKLQSLTPYVEITFGNEFSKIQSLIHSCDGAIVCLAPKNPSQYHQTYLVTAQTLSQILKTCQKPFYLLYTSSTSVYGDHFGNEVDEESECLATSENGRILIETEKLYLQAGKHPISTCVLRLGGIFGPGRELGSIAKRLSSKEFKGRDMPTNLSRLSTITAGIEWCIKHRKTGIYNLVENFHPSRGKLYGNLLQSMSMSPPIWIEPHSGGCRISNAKIKNAGFQFRQV